MPGYDEDWFPSNSALSVPRENPQCGDKPHHLPDVTVAVRQGTLSELDKTTGGRGSAFVFRACVTELSVAFSRISRLARVRNEKAKEEVGWRSSYKLGNMQLAIARIALHGV